MRILIFATLIAIASVASADVDYNCSSNCQASGLSYGLCNARCSYSTAPSGFSGFQGFQETTRMKQTDYACVSRCTANGNLYTYCNQACSY